MLARLLTPILRLFLALLEKWFTMTREKTTPAYPYDERAARITLPATIERELRHLAANGNKVEAVKRVTRLTGAGLRVAKDYVDGLAKQQ